MRLNREMNRNSERLDYTIQTIDKQHARILNEFRDETIIYQANFEKKFDESME
jgi:hypothetical protein